MQQLISRAAVLLIMGLLAAAFAQDATRMFLPANTVDNLARQRLLIDDAGGIHLAMPSVTMGGLYYGYCEPGCPGDAYLSEVNFETDANGPAVALALDSHNRPHLLIHDFLQVSYAWCSGECRNGSGWNYGILQTWDQPDYEVTGDSLAIGPDGRAHFIMHAARSFLDAEHETWYYTCAADCHLAGNWQSALIEHEQSFQFASLKVRADGALVMGMIASDNPELGMTAPLIAYMECAGNCLDGDNWQGAGLFDAYDVMFSSDTGPGVTLQLTAAGQPRLVAYALAEDGTPLLTWASCNVGCLDGTNWTFEVLLDSTDRSFDSGLHLTLDNSERPQIVYAVQGNILRITCLSDCDNLNSAWELAVVEAGSEIPADDIFLYSNCVIGMWFLKDPQVGVLPDGRIATVYTAEDYSFGGAPSVTDPTRPACPIGVDMSLGRLSVNSP